MLSTTQEIVLPPHPTFLFLLDFGYFEAAFLLESLLAASFVEVFLRSFVFDVYSVCQILRWTSLSGLSVLCASEGALLAGMEDPKESLLFTLDQDSGVWWRERLLRAEMQGLAACVRVRV